MTGNNVRLAVEHGWWQRLLSLVPRNQKADVRVQSVISDHFVTLVRLRVLANGNILERERIASQKLLANLKFAA